MAMTGCLSGGGLALPAHARAGGAILLQSVWTIVIALSGRYEQILNYVVSMDFLFFGLTATTIFVFRRRAARGDMPASSGYRVPGHPVTTALFVVICWWVVGQYDLSLSAE